jgi:hypothetical protein
VNETWMREFLNMNTYVDLRVNSLVMKENNQDSSENRTVTKVNMKD